MKHKGLFNWKKTGLRYLVIGVVILAITSGALWKYSSNGRPDAVQSQTSIPKATESNRAASPAHAHHQPEEPLDSTAASPSPEAADRQTPRSTSPAPAASQKECALKIKALKEKYKAKLKDQHDLLRGRLDYLIVGSNIAVDYIHTYNAAAASLHEQYKQQAVEHACIFPEPKPESLNDSYTP
ncbi:MAG TPA: hypothetical protein VK983_04465 [Candidatus Limnocylindrales bacterium]|nr:hypothetical protein [Candidatus Limnocylindrales bacterium]